MASNMAFLTKSLSQFISSGIPYKADPVPSPYILSTSPPDSSMEIYVLEHRLRVCFIEKNAITEYCHSLIKISLLSGARPKFFSMTETKHGYTLIVTDSDFQKLPTSSSLHLSGQLWRVLTVSVGAMGSNNELGGISKIAKSVIGPLADHEISVLCMSTYQSDFILVKETQLDDAVRCLGSSFKIFNEDHKRLNDSQILSSSPTSPSITKKMRPIMYPLHCPDSLYHITGLDESKLPSVIQILMELLFYSGDREKEPDNGLHFFHFSIVSGDISLVLDTESIKKFPSNVLYTRKSDDNWKMVMLGDSPLGFDECGIVAQVVEPLASSQISTYYISSYNHEYFMILEKDAERIIHLLEKLKHENFLSCNGESIAEEQQNNTSEDMMEILDTTTTTPITTPPPPHDKHDDAVDASTSPVCQNMSLGEQLQQKENICPYESTGGVHQQQHLQHSCSKTLMSDESSCGTSPMSDGDGTTYSVINQHQNNENRKYRTDPIPIPP